MRISLNVLIVLSLWLQPGINNENMANAWPLNNIANAPEHECPENMAWIPGGTFAMGSDQHYREEQQTNDITVDGFCIDQYEVTNAQFAQFVDATGYTTVAERPLI